MLCYGHPCGESDPVEALLVGIEEDVVVRAHLELEVTLKFGWLIQVNQAFL